MPKVVVYVSAAKWRELEAEGKDPADYIRDLVKENLHWKATGEISEPIQIVADSQPRDVTARTVASPAPSYFPERDFKGSDFVEKKRK